MARILIVDDDPDCVELLSVYFSTRGHAVLQAKSGREALERAARDNPDLVLLDQRMPAVDGVRVVEILRADALTAEKPVILMSAASLAAASRIFSDDPATRCIEKPLDFNKLDALCGQLLSAALR